MNRQNDILTGPPPQAAIAEKRGCRAHITSLLLSAPVRFLGLCLALAFTGHSHDDAHSHDFAVGKSESAGNKLVKVITRREGDTTILLVENRELGEVTMSFNFELKNLKSSKDLPFTATFAPQSTTEAVVLSPVDPDEPWDYSFVNYHNLGSSIAVHDDSFCYSLPYQPGKKYRVSQGYDGTFSHKGSNRYAIDWAMPVGTPVHATRGGLVVRIRDGSDRGGADMKYDRYNNFVLVRHSDGTLGQYCHLRKGISVREGDVVRAGDLLAHSGNTGFSSGPHLHFSVYKTKSGKERESIPVKFLTAEATGITLKTGQKHAAVAPISEADALTARARPRGNPAS